MENDHRNAKAAATEPRAGSSLTPSASGEESTDRRISTISHAAGSDSVKRSNDGISAGGISDDMSSADGAWGHPFDALIGDLPIDSTIHIVTPENITFQYQVAGPFRRLPAFIIDLIVRAGLWVGILILVTVVLSQFRLGPNVESAGFAFWLVSWFVLEWFYGAVLETMWNGQTVGKRALQMRVLRVDGQPVTGMQAVVRNILRTVDLMPLLPLGMWSGGEGPWVVPTCLIGLLTPIMNRRYQRLGDLVCGTMVIVEQQRQLVDTTRLMKRVELQQLLEGLPNSFVTGHKLTNALATYVERRRHLSRGRRVEIASHLAPQLAALLKLPPDIDPDLLLCALYNRVFVSNEDDRKFTTSEKSS